MGVAAHHLAESVELRFLCIGDRQLLLQLFQLGFDLLVARGRLLLPRAGSGRRRPRRARLRLRQLERRRIFRPLRIAGPERQQHQGAGNANRSRAAGRPIDRV